MNNGNKLSNIYNWYLQREMKRKNIILQSKMLENVTFWSWNCNILWQILLLEIWSWKVSESQERYQILSKTGSATPSYKLISKISWRQRSISMVPISLQRLERKSCRRWREKVAMKPQRLSLWLCFLNTLFSSEKYGN